MVPAIPVTGARVQVLQAAVARGIPMDGVIGFLLLKTCYASIRMLWARTHAQIAARRAHADDAADDSPSPAKGAPTNGALANDNSNNNDAKGDAGGGSTATCSTATSNFNAAVNEAARVSMARVSGTADSANGAVEPGGGGREAWAARMMHALTGRTSVTLCEEGTRSARDWRERAHLVYRCGARCSAPVGEAPHRRIRRFDVLFNSLRACVFYRYRVLDCAVWGFPHRFLSGCTEYIL